MRSAILLAFVALYGCASAPGYRSSSVRSPASFREDPQPLATSPEDHPLASAPEGPHPLSPSPSGRGGTTDVCETGQRDVQVDMTEEVAHAYYELRGEQEKLEVDRRNAENQRHTFELTQERLAAGRGSAFDTERAQAQLSSTLASIPAREAQVAAAQYRIGTLVGRSPTDVARELEQTGPLPSLPEVTSIGTPDAVVRYRPDVAAAERV